MATVEGTRAEASRRPYRPWLQRLIEASGLPPWRAGIAIGFAHLGLFFAWHALGWALGLGSPRDRFFWEQMVGPNVINAAVIGYAPAAMAWSRREARSELTRLGPLLPQGGSEFRERITRFPRRPMAVVGAAFALMILPLIVVDPNLNAYWNRVDAFARAWMLFVNSAMGWLITRAVFEEMRLAHVFRRAGERLAVVDLFDLSTLEPFSRRAVESVLVWIVGASLLSLIFAGDDWASDTLPILVAAVLIPGGIAFAQTLAGVHERIRAAKRAELARIHARARLDREALLEAGAGAAEGAARLPALLALRSQVAEVREWPVDLPTLARLAGFVAIGLASWVGAALVEAAIDAALR
jgi:hypothetical protein